MSRNRFSAALRPAPAKSRSSLLPRRVHAHTACLKWQREEYAARLAALPGPALDYRSVPAEDFARVLVEYEDEARNPVIVEPTTSWSFVGAGLRLSMEVLGPEYSMSINTLESGLALFFSRELARKPGEDMVEKPAAETGLMPVVADEAAAYGYQEEDRHMVACFRAGRRPVENFDDGLKVTELLMTAYLSAEQGRAIEFPPPGLESFVPAVARGQWNPRPRPSPP